MPKEICLRHTTPATMLLATHIASSKPALSLVCCMMLHLIGQLRSTVFLQVVSDDGDILKVPYSMKKLVGSGKNLCEELATEISSIKAVLGDATVRLPDALKAYTSFVASKT